MGGILGIVAAKEPDFMILSLKKLTLFGQEVYLTTTHISLLIICVALILFAVIVRLKLKDTDGKPSALQNVAELIVEMLDGMVDSTMGKYGKNFRNYIGTIFIFILFNKFLIFNFK